MMHNALEIEREKILFLVDWFGHQLRRERGTTKSNHQQHYLKHHPPNPSSISSLFSSSDEEKTRQCQSPSAPRGYPSPKRRRRRRAITRPSTWTRSVLPSTPPIGCIYSRTRICARRISRTCGAISALPRRRRRMPPPAARQ